MEQEKINELKTKYGKIFKVNINDKDWFFRAMTREEFRIYTKEQLQNAENITQLDLEDIIFSMCNLNGIAKEEIDGLPAGIVATVADAVMRATGFSENVEPEEL